MIQREFPFHEYDLAPGLLRPRSELRNSGWLELLVRPDHSFERRMLLRV
jgi:hypothetical protein